GGLFIHSAMPDRLRSPLFKMHRELARMGSTSSEDSVSESETDDSSSNNSGKSSSSSSNTTVETTHTTG
ncbi:hypothetical protein EMWEY_00052290, partial [Eimeria maxima]